jgi:hypothetical protein
VPDQLDNFENDLEKVTIQELLVTRQGVSLPPRRIRAATRPDFVLGERKRDEKSSKVVLA